MKYFILTLSLITLFTACTSDPYAVKQLDIPENEEEPVYASNILNAVFRHQKEKTDFKLAFINRKFDEDGQDIGLYQTKANQLDARMNQLFVYIDSINYLRPSDAEFEHFIGHVNSEIQEIIESCDCSDKSSYLEVFLSRNSKVYNSYSELFALKADLIFTYDRLLETLLAKTNNQQRTLAYSQALNQWRENYTD